MEAVALLIPLALGWALAALLMPRVAGPRWAALLAQLSLAPLVGGGVVSVLVFLSLWSGTWSRGVLLAVPLLLLAGVLFLLWRRRGSDPATAVPRFSLTWMLAICAIAAVGLLLTGMQTTTAANQHGDWDAFATWNLRAKYLAGGEESWRRALTGGSGGEYTGTQHPGYPLLASGLIAYCWTTAGSMGTAAPAVAGAVFSLALGGLLLAATAMAGSTALGLLALLILCATETFSSQSASQYADIPLALAALGALFALWQAWRAPQRSWLVLSGVCAGLAAWTKNEGWIVLGLALLLALRKPGWRGVLWIAAGALPGVFVTMLMKTLVTGESEKLYEASLSRAPQLLSEGTRWWKVIAGFGSGVVDLGFPWAHPVLLFAVLAVALGFVGPAERRDRFWLLLAPAGMLGAVFGALMLTGADLDWQLSTSVNRLLLQPWPALLYAGCLFLRAPEEIAPAASPQKPAAAQRPDKTARARKTTGSR